MTLRDDEPGAQRVAAILANAQSQRSQAYASLMSQMDLMVRVWRSEGEAAARSAQAQLLALPLQWVALDERTLDAAVKFKASVTLSVADAWIAAAAASVNAVLVHKDPEFSALAIAQEMLPAKPKKDKK